MGQTSRPGFTLKLFKHSSDKEYKKIQEEAYQTLRDSLEFSSFLRKQGFFNNETPHAGTDQSRLTSLIQQSADRISSIRKSPEKAAPAQVPVGEALELEN